MKPGDKIIYAFLIDNALLQKMETVQLRGIILRESRLTEYDWVIKLTDALLEGTVTDVYESDLSLVMEPNDVLKGLCSK